MGFLDIAEFYWHSPSRMHSSTDTASWTEMSPSPFVSALTKTHGKSTGCSTPMMIPVKMTTSCGESGPEMGGKRATRVSEGPCVCVRLKREFYYLNVSLAVVVNVSENAGAGDALLCDIVAIRISKDGKAASAKVWCADGFWKVVA